MAEGPVALLTPRRGGRWWGQWGETEGSLCHYVLHLYFLHQYLLSFLSHQPNVGTKRNQAYCHFSFINSHGKCHTKHQVVSPPIPMAADSYLADSSPLFKLQFRCFPFCGASPDRLQYTFLNIIHTPSLLTLATSHCRYPNFFLLLTRRHSLSTELLLFHLSTTSTWDWAWNSVSTQQWLLSERRHENSCCHLWCPSPAHPARPNQSPSSTGSTSEPLAHPLSLNSYFRSGLYLCSGEGKAPPYQHPSCWAVYHLSSIWLMEGEFQVKVWPCHVTENPLHSRSKHLFSDSFHAVPLLKPYTWTPTELNFPKSMTLSGMSFFLFPPIHSSESPACVPAQHSLPQTPRKGNCSLPYVHLGLWMLLSCSTFLPPLWVPQGLEYVLFLMFGVEHSVWLWVGAQ